MSINTTFVTDALQQALPFPRKKSNGGINVNCPMCLSRGEPRPDTKFRCGVRLFSTGGLHINCFNCGFVTKWAPGAMLARNVSLFMRQLGVSERTVQQLKFRAWQLSQNSERSEVAIAPTFIPNFDEVPMPSGALPISTWVEHELDDPDFLDVVQYAFTRGETVFNAGEFYWTPEKVSERIKMHRRLLVPFYWEGKIVGYTGRAVDEKASPRYHTHTPPHFLFNSQALANDRKFAILVEGQFDALAIDGVSSQGAKLSPEQAFWLKESGKRIIVLPDQEEGPKPQKMIDLALENEWPVSFPGWDPEVKDANDAVIKYGKLYTVRSIIDGATDNKIKINLSRKKLGR
jgi:hypothetical protein